MRALRMSDITFEQIEKQYATNPARQAILKELREEIEYWKQTTSALKAWVFGQYFGIADEPERVQVLISAVLKPPDPALPRPIRHEKVQVFRRMGPALVSKEEMIRTFNSHPQNVEEGVTLRGDQVRELTIG
ncbi:MAG TPA: hypothetical protein VGP94_16845 [Tepidisphaeraceae bacterium]|nr:hypothetical protein [Tepidisphaeraceae bacterium]